MAYIDKIYGTNEQFEEFEKWLIENQVPTCCKVGSEWNGDGSDTDIFEDCLPTDYLYQGRAVGAERVISNFPREIDEWLLQNCPLTWVTDRIKEQYGE